MKIFKSAISIIKRLYPGWIVLLLVASMLVFSACKSGDLEETTSEAPSTTKGVDFEDPVEHASGENPTTIINGDWNNDSRTDLMVLNPRKQSGTSSVEDGTLYQFLDNASLTGKFPFSSTSLTPSTAVWRQHV
ncbi:MAG: hypothetical protein VXX76_02085, partial [SAR324 cluster bacterium]|nr:hypothetical protein [SAR324 cluster bacterium]